MAGDFVGTVIGRLLSFTNGRSSPQRAEGLSYPVYGSNGVIGYASEANANKSSIIIGRVGSYCGSLYLSTQQCWVTDNAIRATALDDNDPRFLFYLLGTLNLNNWRVGSGQPLLNQDILSRIPAVVPKAVVQHTIAHILGTLDDKIELNRQMNETLEAMARAIFKSWFVDFDPVRAKMEGRKPFGMDAETAALFPDSFEDAGLGKIPRGWMISTVGKHMVNFDSKRIPVSGAERAKRQGPYPYHGAAGVMDHVDDYLFDGIYVLVGEDGSVVQDSGLAVTQYVWDKLWVNNHAHVLQGKGAVSTEQLYLYFDFEPVVPYVTGAVQPKLSQGRMNTMPFVFADEDVCRAFAETVQPWFSKFRVNADTNKTLTSLRDTLLPKLLSGEVRVKDAEKFAEAYV